MRVLQEPRTYRVVGVNRVHETEPGDTFTRALTAAEEKALIKGHAIEVVDEHDDDPIDELFDEHEAASAIDDELADAEQPEPETVEPVRRRRGARARASHLTAGIATALDSSAATVAVEKVALALERLGLDDLAGELRDVLDADHDEQARARASAAGTLELTTYCTQCGLDLSATPEQIRAVLLWATR